MYDFLYLEPEEAGRTKQCNNLLHINTKNLCLICLKECDIKCAKEGKLLCKVLSRYFGVNFMVPELSAELQRKEISVLLSDDKIPLGDWISFTICENCATVADKLSQQFQKLELIQMKMHEYGRSLCNIMTCAEKIPNRVSRFYTTISDFDDTSEELTATIVKNLRKQVLLKCDGPLNTNMKSILTLPTMKVGLQKEPFLDSLSSILVSPPSLPSSQRPQQTCNETEEYYTLALMGCVVSLWIVILLGLIDTNELSEMWKLKLKENQLKMESLNSRLSSSVSHLQEAISNMSPSPKDADGSENECTATPFQNNVGNTIRKRKDVDDNTDDMDMAGEIKKSLLDNNESVLEEATVNESSRETLQECPNEPTCEDIQILNESGTWEDVTNIQGGKAEEKEEDVHVVSEAGETCNYSSEEVIEDDIIKEDFMRALVRLPQTRKRKRRRRCLHEKYTSKEMKRFSVITAEDAMIAVNAIYISPPTPVDDIKNVEMGEESEVQLCFLDAKLDTPRTLPIPTTNLTGQSETSAHTEYVMLMNIATAVPPIAIGLVETTPANNPQMQQLISAFVESVGDRSHKCRVCSKIFQSRAQVEKHRAVDHKLTDYVECSTCFQMFTSYFHLELHRTTMQKCWIDDTARQLEREDSARPLFPFEKNSIGNNFCPVEDCYEVFDHVKKLSVHLKTHGCFQCRFGCTQTFSKAHELAVHEFRNHQSSIFPTNFFKCPRCDHITEKEDGYVTHFVYQHLSISPYVEECQVCRRGFYSMAASKSHFYMYHDVSGKDEKNAFECDICYGKFLKFEQLSVHRHTVHSYSVDIKQN